MRQSSSGNFAKMVTGFLVFISLSFGLTYAVQSYTISQEKAQQAAAIEAAMLGQ